MQITRILSRERTLDGVHGGSKKKVLQFIAQRISDDVPEINSEKLFELLITRERLGTTGFGKGVAIPHCRCQECRDPVGLFVRLIEPVDFDAVDCRPVDLVFALIVPANEHQEHLEILKALAERFHSISTLEAMRRASDSVGLYNALVQ